jgi:acyl-CoA dehydrogenase
MAFFQSPPRLDHPLHDDRVLRSHLDRFLPPDARRIVLPSLQDMGELARGRLYTLGLEDRPNEPRLVSFDPWGLRIDRVEVTRLWEEAREVACRFGLVALPYERRLGELSRLHQAALIHLFHPASDIYTCPLAMSDGAAKTLTVHGHRELLDRALPRLTSRSPERVWTSGQWMTERTGGSDVGLSETVARRDGAGWRLYGTKWFTSAAASEMALTLARPEGNGPGGRGLALFYLETFDREGGRNGIVVHRLKEKLGTRKLPTAELSLEGTWATPVAGLSDGVRNIAPMLNITRYWNAVCSVATMRRGIALARDYARRRVAFGGPLAERPLHLETLAELQAEYEGWFGLVFHVAALLGREEAGTATDTERGLLRLLTPLAKLATGKAAVEVAAEAIEAFGGAGYVEDTGLPALLRDAHVLPIWEGTTNVLALDVVKAGIKEETLPALLGWIGERARAVGDARLAPACGAAIRAAEEVGAFVAGTREPAVLEGSARRVARTLARAAATVLLAEQAAWCREREGDGRAVAAALRFARRLRPVDPAEPAVARALARDEPLPG